VTAPLLQESRAKFSKNVSRVLKAVDWPEGRKPNRPHSRHHHHQDGSATPRQSTGMTFPYIQVSAMPHQSQDLMLAYFKDSVFRDRSAVCQANVHNCRTVALRSHKVVTAAVSSAAACRCPYALYKSSGVYMHSDRAQYPPPPHVTAPRRVGCQAPIRPDEACPFKIGLSAVHSRNLRGQNPISPLPNIGLQGGSPLTPLKGLSCPALSECYGPHMILTYGRRWAGTGNVT